MKTKRFATVLLGCLLALACATREARAETLRVIVPDDDNLQYMSFWVARGAGYFHDEGIDVELVVPPRPQLTEDLVRKHDADVAVLPPPMYLELIAEKAPIVLVANLLQNDPIALVVARSTFDERHMSATAPIADRLRSLHGLKVGVAPHPPKRLRALFAGAGLDADKDVSMVILHGPEQNAAFGAQQVDALYAHTPYLETALVDQNAVVLVNQPGGDVPSLASRQIHALVLSRSLLEASPGTAERLVRAVAKAQRLVHDDPARATSVLATSFPKMDRRHIEKIVEIYRPAIPETPAVSVDGLAPALALFPAGREPPNLDGLDLYAYVAPDVAKRATRPRHGAWVEVASVAVMVALGALAWRSRKRATEARPELDRPK